MPLPTPKTVCCWLFTPFLVTNALQATYQDSIGLYDLRNRDSSLTGSGVIVGQIEAQESTDNYQTDPANAGLGSSLFTYYDSTNPWSGGGAAYDSSRESGHANTVGSRFYGITGGTQGTDGVAPGVSAIEVFEAGHYYNDLVRFGTATSASVVNQSFVFGSQDATVDRNYDNYAANHGVLFVNGINTNSNPATIPSPGSAYNGITVGVIDRAITPLPDNRSKPDIVAPGSTVSSYTTPLVAGAAAILIQSALREDAGTGTAASGSDIRTIKALILNTATKAKGWSNTSTQPLDRPNGAGVLEVNQAQLQLAAGQYAPTQNDIATTAGDSHLPPGGISGNLNTLSGWAFETITNSSTGNGNNRTYLDSTDHYYYDLSSSIAASFYLNATLTWNRQAGQTGINGLDLFLYTEAGDLVASSQSTVDNVEHLYVRHLLPGRYVLQVHKPAGSRVTSTETYALAFNFRPAPAPGAPASVAATTLSSNAINISWLDTSDDETGYRVERRLSGGSYSTVASLSADATAYLDSDLAVATTYDYRITAFNTAGDSASVETSGTTYSVIEDWRLEFFGTTANSGEAADGFDPDSDSQVNLIEFVTGSDPTVSSPAPLDSSLLGSDGQISFSWRIDTGYDFSIGFSTDLTAGFTYYDAATLDAGSSPDLEPVGTTDPVNNLEIRSYRVRDSVTAPQVFLRLRVN